MRAPEFWNRRDGREAARLTRALLTPLSWAYAAAGASRIAKTEPYRADLAVICVGNLTLGGTGKTPVALALLERLRRRGVKAGALTRGYRGEQPGPLEVTAADDVRSVGDEALLLARAALTVVARDRAAGARFAEQLGLSALVMDDGFQNPSLAKDLSLVVVDGETGFGNRCVFPAGPLREPIAAGLQRADAVIVMRGGLNAPREPVPGLEKWNGPLLEAWLEPDPEAAAVLRSKRIVLFAGVGRPQKVADTFTRLGAEIAAVAPFPDHHPYTARDLKELRELAAHHQAVLATTEKDIVRLAPADRADIFTLPVRAAFADEAALETLLTRAIETARERRETPRP